MCSQCGPTLTEWTCWVGSFYNIKWVKLGDELRGTETEWKTKPKSERDVFCLQSISCTHNHTRDPTIICFHLLASFQFSLLSRQVSFYTFFSFLILVQLKVAALPGPCLIALWRPARWLGEPQDSCSSVVSVFCVHMHHASQKSAYCIFHCLCHQSHKHQYTWNVIRFKFTLFP